MDQRGRKSSAALSVVARIDGRPSAPDRLTDRQREIWERTVSNEAADVFRTAATQQLLADYCRHVETSEALSRQIDEAIKPDSDVSIDDLTKMVRLRDCETKASADKATKLRLTNQSRYQPSTAAAAGKKSSEVKPWHRSA